MLTTDTENGPIRSLIVFSIMLLAVLTKAHAAGDQGNLKRGQELYQLECVACHGAQGDGNGSGAYILSQKPRNFQLGVFKLRSTPSGEHPTDQDLFDTLSRGISGATGAMMPGFAAYSQADRWSLVAAVKTLAEIDKPGLPIDIPPRPQQADFALGAQVYERLECASCHGATGVGDGTSSLTLEDDLEHRIWVPDLTLGKYKGGDTPDDIYTRVVTGLDGTPMPAYAGKATPAELWALTEFVMSLAKPEK